MLERFVNGQDVFIMYESWSSCTLDNKVNKESDQAKHSEHWAQAYYGLLWLKRENSQANRSITFYKDRQARQNYVLNELNCG